MDHEVTYQCTTMDTRLKGFTVLQAQKLIDAKILQHKPGLNM